MSGRNRRSTRFCPSLVVSFIFLISCFPASIFSAVVTLDSIKIYNAHEFLKTKPTVYFHCQGENETKTVLPDVKEVNVNYTFNGEESWQPLTELAGKKCKRCGFYEKDTFKPDDVYDEWEFCPSDFKGSDGKYHRVKDKEFEATFLCAECVSVPAAGVSKSPSESHDKEKGKGMHIAVVIIISALVSTVVILGIVAGYKYWQKKKREQDQARFLKLFEDGDDIEDELELGTVL